MRRTIFKRQPCTVILDVSKEALPSENLQTARINSCLKGKQRHFLNRSFSTLQNNIQKTDQLNLFRFPIVLRRMNKLEMDYKQQLKVSAVKKLQLEHQGDGGK